MWPKSLITIKHGYGVINDLSDKNLMGILLEEHFITFHVYTSDKGASYLTAFTQKGIFGVQVEQIIF